MRTSDNHYKDGKLYNGYDYDKQVWVLKGIYQRCGHLDGMSCGCYGKAHAGERVTEPEVHNIPLEGKILAILSPKAN